MNKINIKAISVNICWRGRRFKTNSYQAYEKEMMYLLPKLIVPKGKLELTIKVGFSSKNADLDNVAKPLIDVLQKKYEFNDKKIYKLILEKEDVKKGDEYVYFSFDSCHDTKVG